MTGQKNKAAIEAILFMMGGSVESDRIAEALEITNEEALTTLLEMKREYDEDESRGIKMIEIDGKFQLCTKKEFYPEMIRIASKPKRVTLTDVLMETLSIIAYKQPVTKLEIEKIRGVKSDHAVNRLVEYNLACELGRLDAPGRPIVFGTTEDFLRHFGISSLSDLPSLEPEKQADFMKEAQKEAETELKV